MEFVNNLEKIEIKVILSKGQGARGKEQGARRMLLP
jgi:hypothetical protein